MLRLSDLKTDLNYKNSTLRWGKGEGGHLIFHEF